MKPTGAVLALLLLASLGTEAVAANLVTNPSFEVVTGTFGGDGGLQLAVGSTSLTGWTIVGAESAVLRTPNSYNLTASDGHNFLDLTGYTSAGFPKGVSQTLTGLIVGATYRFGMDVGIRNGACVGGGGCSGPVQVSASIGSISQTFTHNSAAPGNIWGRYGFDFTATASSMTLTIRGVSGFAFIGLDNVSVDGASLPGVEAVSGPVVLKTPLSTQPLVAGGGIAPGSLIETGGTGTATVTFADGTRLLVDPNTQVTIVPPADPAAPDTTLNLVKGFLRHIRDSGVPGSGRYFVQTQTATVRPTGTEFTTGYSDTNHAGSLSVALQRGIVDVTNRRSQTTTLTAGAQASFDDAVPRVTLVLPVTRGAVVPGKANTFSWTSFAGATGYLIEYTVSPAGFALANAPSVQAPANTIPLPPGAFNDAGGTVEFAPFIPTGAIPAGLRLQWRVFPTDAAGVILPGSTASDASTFTVAGSRVSPLSPADGATIATPAVVTFGWTSYAGAAGYLFEFTLNPGGFAQVNPASVESPARAIRLVPGIYTQTGNTVELSVPLPAGAVPPGTHGQWRVFPVDAAGQILPNTTASDARTVVFQ